MMTCTDVAERDLVERYVAGRIGDDEAEPFEAHYLTCERCQREIRLAAATRAALADGRARRRRGGRYGAWVLAAAAALAAVLLVSRERVPADVARLGAVDQPPVYLGVPVRAEETSADDRFAAAMRDYAAGDYAAAADGLRAARDAGVDRPPADFFLGTSLLMLGRDAEAVDAFDRVIALGETPYLTEAYFYRAKARLRQGTAAAALADLERAAAGDGIIAAYAVALADSVRAVVGP